MPKSETKDLEFQYKKYLNLMGLKESRMHPAQKRETKRAFYGGAGMILQLLVNEITLEDEASAVASLDDLLKQVGEFMKNEAEG